MKIIVYCCILLFSTALKSQEINFDDLSRMGSGLSKAVTISGLAKDANFYKQSFIEKDTSRIEARKETARSNSSSNDSNSGPDWVIVKTSPSNTRKWLIQTRIKCLKSSREENIYTRQDGDYETLGFFSSSYHKSFEQAAKSICY